MPVSKKRKKDGKPVHRTEPVVEGAEHEHGPDGPQKHGPLKAAKPSNPFVSKPITRSSQRGR